MLTPLQLYVSYTALLSDMHAHCVQQRGGSFPAYKTSYCHILTATGETIPQSFAAFGEPNPAPFGDTLEAAKLLPAAIYVLIHEHIPEASAQSPVLLAI